MAATDSTGIETSGNFLDKFTPTNYTHHLDKSLQKAYLNKLSDLNSSDPYTVPEVVFSPNWQAGEVIGPSTAETLTVLEVTL